MEKTIALKSFDDDAKTDYREELTVPDDYFAYRENFKSMLEQVERMRDGHCDLIETVQHQIELNSTYGPEIHSVSDWARPMVSDSKNKL